MRRAFSFGSRVAIISALSAASVYGATGKAFHPPKPYVLETLYKEIKAACPSKEWSCFEKQINAYTMTYGPRAATETFTLLRDRHDIDPSVDAHHVVHHIGHHTAMAFGSNAQAFNLCPTDYNYGCLHGFFQEALSSGGATEEAAGHICEDLEKDPSVLSKTKFSCFHGLGHGVMMFEDHDLDKSLKVCDALKSTNGQEGCWQGVFMENVDAAEEGQWKKGQFSLDDPLAPCDKMAEKHQHQCFINHSAWLMMFYKNNIGRAAQACLKAPKAEINTCAQTLGQLTTNPAWVPTILPGADPNKFPENAWSLCKRFPKELVEQCVTSGVSNILNSLQIDTATVQTAGSFCQAVDPAYGNICYEKIGSDLRYLTPDFKAAHDACVYLKDPGKTKCLSEIAPS